MLDYYHEIGFVPVSQDISDLAAHFARRSNLYLQLGIAPNLLKNRAVIEFGPGTGDNAVHTASLSPASYVLVEGHRDAIGLLKGRNAAGDFGGCRVEIVESDFFEFVDSRTFDLVWCEGAITGDPNIKKLISHISGFVAKNGILVLAYSDPVGLFAEACRHALKPVFYRDGPVPIERLVDFFGSHLEALGSVSRLPEHWVRDTILYPWEPYLISTPEIIDALSESFQVLGALPRYIQEWRWYKKMTFGDPSINDSAKAQYVRNAFQFLDERSEPTTLSATESDCRQLIDLCRRTFTEACRIWHSNDVREVLQFLDVIRPIQALTSQYMPETAQSIDDFATGTKAAIERGDWSRFGRFTSHFGRPQHYLSLVRL